MNGVGADSVVKSAFPMWQLMRAFATVALVGMGYLAFKLSHVIAGTRTLWQVIRRKPKKGQQGQ